MSTCGAQLGWYALSPWGLFVHASFVTTHKQAELIVSDLFVVNLTQAGVWQVETTIEKMPSSDWPVGKSVGGISLTEVGGPSPLGVMSPRQVVLGSIRKQAERLKK